MPCKWRKYFDFSWLRKSFNNFWCVIIATIFNISSIRPNFFDNSELHFLHFLNPNNCVCNCISRCKHHNLNANTICWQIFWNLKSLSKSLTLAWFDSAQREIFSRLALDFVDSNFFHIIIIMIPKWASP